MSQLCPVPVSCPSPAYSLGEAGKQDRAGHEKEESMLFHNSQNMGVLSTVLITNKAQLLQGKLTPSQTDVLQKIKNTCLLAESVLKDSL